MSSAASARCRPKRESAHYARRRGSCMSVQALGYIGLRAKDLGDWATFGSNFLGMQRIDKTRASMAFRMDDRKQRVIIDADGGQGIGYFGWEVADAAAMRALSAKL